ncbi:OsmC family protein [Paeniglutamicibacter cryotolerans]|uniref:Putative OsmC-like protein n=1 Tax=Paeniglutamicibacter cryotolerans TaxID=670079 RepID=A0A839QU61_9MICC|nr:OsmC family protein [Paeniglutamicibacter cryotolerans]MBB2996812.1 putative OsmC-like protein [Paeniglutamicibacter cryotolerans]
MTDTSQSPSPVPSARSGPASVSATRTGARTYIGRNARGSQVLIGPTDAPGHFTPGELLKLALAGCAGMSSDRVTARRLGEDFASTIWAHGESDPAEDRYFAIDEEVLLELNELSEADKQKLLVVIGKAIAASCTIARSVGGSIELNKSINAVPLHD